MGVDEALLRSASAGGIPALRFYRWRGPWLSLGYAQADDPARDARCAGAGVGVVRRCTGGRAVLHGSDLTYALAAPASALPAGLRASYALVGEALGAGLRALGVAVERSAPAEGTAAQTAFDCFARPAAEELCAGGAKLVGSAQRRAGGGVLQHGSLRVAPDPPEARRASGLAATGATSLRELGLAPTDEALRDALALGFEAVFGVRLERSGLAPEERRFAARRGRNPLLNHLLPGPSAGPRSQGAAQPADR
jgi:lipoate-protein ligase A